MAIKVSASNPKTQNVKPFPKLMKSESGRIVFMTSYGAGFQLNNCCDDEPHFFGNWIMGDFTDYNEPITLQNQ